MRSMSMGSKNGASPGEPGVAEGLGPGGGARRRRGGTSGRAHEGDGGLFAEEGEAWPTPSAPPEPGAAWALNPPPPAPAPAPLPAGGALAHAVVEEVLGHLPGISLTEVTAQPGRAHFAPFPPPPSRAGRRYYVSLRGTSLDLGVYAGSEPYRQGLRRRGHDWGRLGGEPGDIRSYNSLEPALNAFVQGTGLTPIPIYWW